MKENYGLILTTNDNPNSYAIDNMGIWNRIKISPKKIKMVDIAFVHFNKIGVLVKMKIILFEERIV
ncbi:MAG: hypothetical protein QME58_12075 [Bacteroidota bacterium]|nr:hypothetical protein [Bacteroidota bacterium]